MTKESPTMTAWGRMFYNAMSGFNNEAETGLVRMFRVEYAKEYRQLKKMGAQLDDAFVRQYIRNLKG
jgi:hypothetical protein